MWLIFNIVSNEDHPMNDYETLSFNTRKALCVQLGENAGEELARVLELLLRRMPTVAGNCASKPRSIVDRAAAVELEV
jgi:hypothetical protein